VIVIPEKDNGSIMNEAFRQLKENLRRLRALEERYELSESQIENVQTNVLEKTTANKDKIEKLTHQIKSMEDKLLKISNAIVRIDKGLEKSVSISEIEELKNLVSLYTPFADNGKKMQNKPPQKIHAHKKLHHKKR
jgi:hypothetical protein